MCIVVGKIVDPFNYRALLLAWMKNMWLVKRKPQLVNRWICKCVCFDLRQETMHVQFIDVCTWRKRSVLHRDDGLIANETPINSCMSANQVHVAVVDAVKNAKQPVHDLEERSCWINYCCRLLELLSVFEWTSAAERRCSLAWLLINLVYLLSFIKFH